MSSHCKEKTFQRKYKNNGLFVLTLVTGLTRARCDKYLKNCSQMVNKNK